VVLITADVSEEIIASIIRMEKISELGTALEVTRCEEPIYNGNC
jgi:hypothetical protein